MPGEGDITIEEDNPMGREIETKIAIPWRNALIKLRNHEYDLQGKSDVNKKILEILAISYLVVCSKHESFVFLLVGGNMKVT